MTGQTNNTLGAFAGQRDNNFNLLRFIAATLVIFGHSYPLTNNYTDPLALLVTLDIPRIAVDIFFVTSGFLVTGSLFARKDITTFCMSRILRIFPALVIALLLTVLVLGPVFTTLPLAEYLQHPATWGYLKVNTLLYDTQFNLPGVFEQLAYPITVNGSLWTLPWEIRMYLVLAILGFFTYEGPRWLPEKALQVLVVAIAVITTVLVFVTIRLPPTAVDPKLADGLRFASLFFIGGACHVLRNRIVLRHWLALVLVALVIALENNILHIPGVRPYKAFLMSYSLVIGYLVLYLAYLPGGFIRRFNRLGDYSYGIYIYAFPIQQVVSALGGAMQPWQMFVFAFPVTLMFAMVSWHYIEKPMLQLKRQPVAAL